MRAGAIAAPAMLLLASACAPPPPTAPAPAAVPAPPRLEAVDSLVAAPPTAVGMDPRLPATLDSIVAAAIAQRASPGAAIAVARYGREIVLRGYGRLSDEPGDAAVTDSTLYDLASLTKVIATTTAAMILEEEGRLQIDRPVAFYLPELASPAAPGEPFDTAKTAITVRMLLTHSGGLEAYATLYDAAHGSLRNRDEYLRAIAQRPLAYAPGTGSVYSDWDFVLVQLVIERITGEPLDRFVEERVFRPLGMHDTMYRPDPVLRARIAPTAVDSTRGGRLRGVVHDGNAWAIGGVSGHAGLFSSARDLAVFAQMLLNGGSYGGVRILRPETIARWTARQQLGSSRALGWDTPSGRSSSGNYFSARAFGHTGFTGTSLWLDPERGLFVVLLTNRVYYGESNERHAALRRAVADAVQRAVLDAPLVDWGERR